MAATCPSCGSSETRKLSELWEEFRSGASADVARIEAELAAKMGDAGAVAEDPAEAVRALLTRELAPPEKKYDLPLGGSCLQMSLGILMIAAGLVMVTIATIRLAKVHLGTHQILIIAVGGLAIAALGYAIGRIGFPKPTYRGYEERLEAWQRTYRCMKCGTRFAVDGEPPAPPA